MFKTNENSIPTWPNGLGNNTFHISIAIINCTDAGCWYWNCLSFGWRAIAKKKLKRNQHQKNCMHFIRLRCNLQFGWIVVDSLLNQPNVVVVVVVVFFLLLFWFLTLKIGPSSDMLDYIRTLQSEKKTIIKIQNRNGKPNANYIAPFPVRWKTMSFFMHEYGWHDTHGLLCRLPSERDEMISNEIEFDARYRCKHIETLKKPQCLCVLFGCNMSSIFGPVFEPVRIVD